MKPISLDGVTHRHAKIHNPRKKYLQKCGVCFKYVEKLYRHMRKHSSEKPFECSICDQKFKYKFALSAHYRERHNPLENLKEKQFQCDHCSKMLANKNSLKQHCKNLHGTPSVVECVFCKRIFKKASEHKHILRHIDETPYSCDMCEDKNFLTCGERDVHLRSHTGEKIHKCDVCQASYTGSENLRIHQVRMHGADPTLCDKFKCNVCGRTLSGRSSLVRHKMTHSNERPYKCNFCEKSFRRKDMLATHKRNHVVSNGDQIRWSCLICGIELCSKSALNHHISIHTGERKVYKCGHCKKSLSSAATLKNHEKTHMKDRPRPYKCCMCNFTFTDKPSLRRHFEAKHTQPKCYTCNYCVKTFASRNGLKLHEKVIHFGAKPRHKCVFCSREFHTTNELFYHLLKHTNETPYSCCVCDISYSNKTSFRIHNRRNHKSSLKV